MIKNIHNFTKDCISSVRKVGHVGEKPTHMAYLILVTIESHHWYGIAAACTLACLVFTSGEKNSSGDEED